VDPTERAYGMLYKKVWLLHGETQKIALEELIVNSSRLAVRQTPRQSFPDSLAIGLDLEKGEWEKRRTGKGVGE